MHMCAIDWCPAFSLSTSSLLASSTAQIAASSSGISATAFYGASEGMLGGSSGGGVSSGMMSSNKTTMTSHAARLGDDSTDWQVTTMDY